MGLAGRRAKFLNLWRILTAEHCSTLSILPKASGQCDGYFPGDSGVRDFHDLTDALTILQLGDHEKEFAVCKSRLASHGRFSAGGGDGYFERLSLQWLGLR